MTRPTKLGRIFPMVSTSSLGGGGGTTTLGLDGTFPGSGQVPTSTGSNTWAWASNVARITSNSSNILVGPFVNFASGTGIAFGAASNTLTISSTVTGGGGGGGSTTAAEYIVGSAHADLSAEKVRRDIYKNYHPDSYPSTFNAVSNEFDGGGGGSYAWTDSPGTTNENSEYPGHLYFIGSNNVGVESYCATYAPGATDFTVVAKVSLGGRVASDNAAWQVGVNVLDSGNADIWHAIALNDTGSDGLITYRYNDTSISTVTTGIGFGSPIWVMIQRTSANVYTGFFSANGMVWTLAGSSTVATTVAKVGVYCNNVSTNTYNRAIVDYIRVFDSLTFKIGS